jgi:hypothetical protein
MKPFFQHLRLALIAIIVASPAIATAQPKLEMHRVGAKADDGSGWHLAVSSKGSFSVLLPIPFNDFTTNDASTGETSYVVGAKSSEGIKFSAVELARAAKPLPDLDSIPKSLATTPANKVSDVRRSTEGEADVLTLTTANAATTLYMRCIQLGGVRYVLTIEFPNAYRELVAANKDRFFESFKLKTKS